MSEAVRLNKGDVVRITVADDEESYSWRAKVQDVNTDHTGRGYVWMNDQVKDRVHGTTTLYCDPEEIDRTSATLPSQYDDRHTIVKDENPPKSARF
jgi:protein involved in polysaccharide export with SLBB domain